MNILKVFNQAFDGVLKGDISNIYVTVDIHDTIFKGHSDELIWLGNAKECLRYLSDISLFKIVIWTGATLNDVKKELNELDKNGIKYIGVNSNDSSKNVPNKLYTNILIDDRSGFEPETDWELIMNYLKSSFEIQTYIDSMTMK